MLVEVAMRHLITTITVYVISIILTGGVLFPHGQPVARAQTSTQPPVNTPIFRVPFDIPPGLSTWYIIQFYGNTTGAYRNRDTWYDQGQGLHFGIDFAAKCGTRVVAIGDGVVTKIDAPRHGAGPHNLMINHPNGYASFYGHLLEEAQLTIGQKVKAGDFVALTGDPDLTCSSRPHLHLEVRNENYNLAYNPVPMIDADWDSLALLSSGGNFEIDLDNPRQWTTIDDQPMVDFGGELLNNYENPWPPDW